MRRITPERPLDNPLLDRRSFFRGALGAAAVGFAVACGPVNDNQHPRVTPTPQHELSMTMENSSTLEHEKYPSHTVMATIFGVDEEASADNAGISNQVTAWDSNPAKRFGGVDDLNNRTKEGLPVDFTPKHNPYYFALPADEFNENGLIPGAREASPWNGEKVGSNESLFKSRWIKITREGIEEPVYAQWLDTGPSDNPDETRDYSYVFGGSSATPQNTFGLKAGIDLSPAAAHVLGFSVKEGGAAVTWQFVDAEDVPDGPWKDYPPIDNKTYWN